MGEDNNDKIVLATRTKLDGLVSCIERIRSLDSNIIAKSYIVCNLRTRDKRFNNIRLDNIEVVFDEKPTRPTAFNKVIYKMKESKYDNHFLTFSREVELRDKDIKEMLREIKGQDDNVIVVGYTLKDNVLSDEERKLYSNNTNGNKGIAYQVPWGTCAFWNKKFIYEDDFEFDKICEKKNNQLGELEVKVDGRVVKTDYEGMEDGLVIAQFTTKNPELKFKLLDKELPWNIVGNEERIKKHKKKLARKNIVLDEFMRIKGYSIDALMKAKIEIK